ncbi:MAG: SDR family NAD(P)-dependent oxidoreductase [Sphingomonadales bacterium]|nr:SDR family NAD(P)-dependent oxidoreductase [Sphingomonadales bacterium]
MAGRVQGKVALVTGGAMGLGKADCIRLAEEGAKVIVTDIDIAKAQAVADAIGGEACSTTSASKTSGSAFLAISKNGMGGSIFSSTMPAM